MDFRPDALHARSLIARIEQGPHNLVLGLPHIRVGGVDVALRGIATCEEIAVDANLASWNPAQWIGRAGGDHVVHHEYRSWIDVLVSASAHIDFPPGEGVLLLVQEVGEVPVGETFKSVGILRLVIIHVFVDQNLRPAGNGRQPGVDFLAPLLFSVGACRIGSGDMHVVVAREVLSVVHPYRDAIAGVGEESRDLVAGGVLQERSLFPVCNVVVGSLLPCQQIEEVTLCGLLVVGPLP